MLDPPLWLTSGSASTEATMYARSNQISCSDSSATIHAACSSLASPNHSPSPSNHPKLACSTRSGSYWPSHCCRRHWRLWAVAVSPPRMIKRKLNVTTSGPNSAQTTSLSSKFLLMLSKDTWGTNSPKNLILVMRLSFTKFLRKKTGIWLFITRGMSLTLSLRFLKTFRKCLVLREIQFRRSGIWKLSKLVSWLKKWRIPTHSIW